MSEGRARAQLDSLLDKLNGYAVMHFTHEEDCMAKYNCPVAAQNIEMHKTFIATFAGFREELEETGPTAHLAVRLQNELMRWLISHIKATDTQLGPCVKSHIP